MLCFAMTTMLEAAAAVAIGKVEAAKAKLAALELVELELRIAKAEQRVREEGGTPGDAPDPENHSSMPRPPKGPVPAARRARSRQQREMPRPPAETSGKKARHGSPRRPGPAQLMKPTAAKSKAMWASRSWERKGECLRYLICLSNSHLLGQKSKLSLPPLRAEEQLLKMERPTKPAMAPTKAPV